MLTALNFLNYIDRAVIAAVVEPMSKDLQLSHLEAGLLNSAFLIGYFTTSPWFGARADRGSRKGLITLGVVIWSIATVASGLASEFWSLLAARIVVGVGESSFAVLAPTIIDDSTPSDRKAKALAMFFLAIPLGYAMGYILGGAVAHNWGWRAAFFVSGGPGIVLAMSCLLIIEPSRKLADAKAKLIDGLREIVKLPLFRRAVLGYAVYTAGVGAFSYWAPNFLVERFPRGYVRWFGVVLFERFPNGLTLETANRWFGIVLIIAGAVGTIIGGRWADGTIARLPQPAAGAPYDAPEHKAAVQVMLRISALGMIVAAPLAALCFFMPSSFAFFAIAFVVEVGLFVSTSPVNAALFRAVPPERRASSMAANIFVIHLFGDLWSAAALGLLQDLLPLRIAMMALPLSFAWSAYVWWPRLREAAGPSVPTVGPAP